MADEKKNIFGRIGDAFSKKDEEAAEEAKQLAESQAKAEAAREARKVDALKKQADDAKVQLEKAQAEVEKAKDEASKLRAEQAAAKAKELMEKREAEAAAQKKFMEEAAAKAKAEAEAKAKAEAEAKAAIVKHVWTNEDTYSSLAFKHYGSIQKPYWWLIYEHNKAIIGDNPNSIKTGTEIEIPPLPEELKNPKK